MVKKRSNYSRFRSLGLIVAVMIGSITPAGWLPQAQAKTADHVVISEVYGGGGNSGATYKNDFIELYNPTGQAISLSGWSVQYASAAGSTWQKTELSGSIPPNGYYLIQEAAGSGGTQSLPVPDAQGSIAMGASAGKVALVSHATVLSGTNPVGQTGVIDFVGYGTTANAAEGGAPTAAPSAAVGISRKSNESGIVPGDGNGWDTDNNGADFLTADLSPINALGTEEPPPGPGDVTSIAVSEARVKANGTVVAVEGIVTAIFEAGGQNNVYVQDETAGIVLRAADVASKISIGDKVRAQGKVNQYYGLAQLEANASDVTVLQPQAGVPAPQLVTSLDFSADKGESLEAELVTLHGVTVEKNDNGNYTLRDENGTFVSRPGASLPLSIGTTYESVTGVVTYDFNVFKLVPRFASDLVTDASKVPVVTATPAGPMVAAGTKVALSTALADAVIHYTTDGSKPTRESQTYAGPIQVDAEMTIKAFAVKDGYTDSDIASFTYTIQKDAVRIHDIQGRTHTSVYDNSTVNGVEGIVTAVVKSGSSVQGFYMQDPQPDNDLRTSEGIYVYEPRAAVAPGDLVSVSGVVKEYVSSSRAATDLTQTQIDASAFTVVSPKNPIPQPVVLGEGGYSYPEGTIDNDSMTAFDPEEDGIDFWESVEGMLVQINNPIVVGETKTFTNPASVEFVVIDDKAHPDQPRTPAGGVLLQADDNHPERITVADKLLPITSEPKVGDRLSEPLVGIIDYSFSNYKLYHTEPFEVTVSDYQPTVTKIDPEDDELTIASYNIENFSSKADPAKVARIAETIVHNLKQPDIIGVVEMQDNNGPTDTGITDARESAQTLIDAVEAEGGPDYRYVDIAPQNNQDGGQPGGNIRVGFFYNPQRVVLAEGTAGDAVTAVQVATTDGVAHLSLNPGRVDPENEAFDNSRKPLAAEFVFQGKPVIVIANHFNSKGGDGGLYGKQQPPELVSEAQRMKIAGVLNQFVKEIHASDPKANVVVLGDLNDFPFSRPVQALKDGVLTNMVEELPAGKQYTYVYQGNSQVLDQILVSNHLADDTKIDIVHINAGFTEKEGRVSDHDPVLVQIDVPDQGEKEPTAKEVAEGITEVSQPAADATRLTLPKVPEGFSIRIQTSSDPQVIALDGTITPPVSQTDVELVFEVKREADQSVAATSHITVHVPAKIPTEPGDPTAESQRELNEQAAELILAATGEEEINQQVTRVLDSLEKVVRSEKVEAEDKWETVQHSITTVLAAVVKQTERGIIREQTLAQLTVEFLERAFEPTIEAETDADEKLARQGFQVLTSLAQVSLAPLGKKAMTDDLAEQLRSTAETLLKKAATLRVERGEKIEAADYNLKEIMELIADFMKAIEKRNDRIAFEPILFIQVDEEKDAAGALGKKREKAEQMIVLDGKLVELMRKNEVAARMIIPSAAWAQLTVEFLDKYRGKSIGLSLLPSVEKVEKVLHPGDPYTLYVWTNGKEMNSFGNTGVQLGLPVSSEAGDKLEAYLHRGKAWMPVKEGRGKAGELIIEDDQAVFTAEMAAPYVIGEASIKSITVKENSLKLAQGEEVQLNVIATLADGSKEDVTKAEGIDYESSDPEVAAVDENGMIRVATDAKERSKATITVSYAGKTAQVKVTLSSK
ncbi:chitobiase/beta-hexosaminidase C-terminal domain-containing protein [Brevibacillus choshinensis]|uniref:Chitobiase/beta-hexosaminidase C-terminal domain-containing protein n=1 Tax=Brevibacillus choshinensis TaxID=54911 RepID=A0ABX7FN98_BRECH|nr:chitobiase/beta-hexosaminidase C-terminal domain-containing protein [Brevibacillus choshinensis]QRG66445.1 chitobiase/beta-hexosaminidase C-terminal domain-containing protein [Brevibacillus choshinensis]